MKENPSLVRQMWLLFAGQVVLAGCITATSLAAALTMLHVEQTTKQENARLLPAIRLHLQNEQDPIKLRREANGLLDEISSDAAFQEWSLRFLIKILALYGVGFFVFSFGSAACAYRLQREDRKRGEEIQAQAGRRI
jgi:hypothetical protein